MMIQTRKMWFSKFLRSDDPLEWLARISELLQIILNNEPHRSQAGRIDSGAKIIGPVAFGKDCIVGHGALVVGPAIFGDGCVIGHASEVTRSIFGNHSRAAHFNYVGDSVLGSRINLGAGAKLANSRFDKKEIIVAGRKFAKFGALIGDACEIGCNVVFDPGVILHSGVWFAGAHLPAGEYDSESVKKFFYRH